MDLVILYRILFSYWQSGASVFCEHITLIQHRMKTMTYEKPAVIYHLIAQQDNRLESLISYLQNLEIEQVFLPGEDL